MRKLTALPVQALLCCAFTPFCYADVSITTTLVSDYLFNGLSQTNDEATLQGSLDWWNDSGWYAGSFASGVDYGQGTDYEVDFYAGHTGNLNESLVYDVGVARYLYLGGDESSEFNYTEFYAALNYNETRVQVWYTDDYFGVGARHYIVALSQGYQINDSVYLTFQIDRSTSLDPDIYSWDTNDDDYIHLKAEAAFELFGLACSLGLEKTDLDYDDDVKLLATVGYTFTF